MLAIFDHIKEKCPSGIPICQIGDLFDQLSGMSGVTNKWADEGNCKFIDYMNAYTHLKIDVSALNYATVKSFNQTVLKKGDILFTSASETPDECALSSVIEEEIDDNVFLDDHLFGLRLKPDREGDNLPSFYQYVFRSYSFRKQIQKEVRGATRYYVSKSDFMRLTVPVPPLSIQKEIVETLDAFTDLTDALNKELEIRKKQYQFYIDEYFGNDLEEMISQSSERGISIKTLSDLGTLTRGKRFVHADAVDDGIPCVHYGELYTYYGIWTDKTKSHVRSELAPKLRYANKNDVIIVGAGENNVDIGVGVAYLGDEPVAIHDACYFLQHSINPKYISYYLRTHVYHNQIKKYVSSGKICAISADGIGRAKLPVPSIEEQNRIVDVFDTFDVLCNDSELGILGEINLRSKQYEYYRDEIMSYVLSL